MISEHCLDSFFEHHVLKVTKKVYVILETYSLYRAGQTGKLLQPGHTSRKHCTLNYRLNMQTEIIAKNLKQQSTLIQDGH